MASEIKPGSLCFVVRNTTGHPCIARDIGRPITVQQRQMVPDTEVGRWGFGFVPVWTIKNPSPCPHCGGGRLFYLEADLQTIDGPKASDDSLTVTVELTERMLEALR